MDEQEFLPLSWLSQVCYCPRRAALKSGLEKIICPDTDSVRIYRLGSNYKNRIEVMGRVGPVEAGEPLLL